MISSKELVTEKDQRLREAHVIKDDDGKPGAIYDIERTFVFEIPDSLKTHFYHSLKNDQADNNRLTITDNPKVRKWLLKNDILTIDGVNSKKASKSTSLPLITDLSLDIAGSCNLGCVYCFEKDIKSRLGPMSEATAYESVDFLFAKAGNGKHVAIHFGSGEPLSNFRLLKQVVAYAEKQAKAQEKDVAFHLTTNGTLITEEVAEFIAEHNFYVRMSIDAIYHNQTRLGLAGNETYEIVENGFRRLRDRLGRKLTVNVVFCRGMRLKEIYNWALNLSITNLEVIKVGTFRDYPTDLNDEHLSAFREDLAYVVNDLYMRAQSDKPLLHYLPITKVLRRLFGPAPTERFCGVASTYLGVSSKGEVYPCFRHLGLEEYHLGDVKSGIDDNKRLKFLSIEAQPVDTRPVCSSCWARKLCGGGCYADSVVYGPDKQGPQIQHCPFWKAEIGAGILLFNKIVNENPELLFTLIGRDLPLDD